MTDTQKCDAPKPKKQGVWSRVGTAIINAFGSYLFGGGR